MAPPTNGPNLDSVMIHGLQSEIVIAVMGTTGTGKSSFIKLLTGNNSVRIGTSLESETSNVQIIRFCDASSGRNATIVDTPGFDDSRAGVTDTDILRTITDFLLRIRREPKAEWPCIPPADFRPQNVVVLTTFWDQLPSEEEGIKREGQLKARFFKDLVDGGACFMRHDRSIESACRVLTHIFMLVPAIAQIQTEIRIEGKMLEDTSAGSVLREEVERIIAKHRKEVAELKAEIETIREGERAMRGELEEERVKLQQALVRWENERSELKKGLAEAKKSRERLEEQTSNLQAQYNQRKNTRQETYKTAGGKVVIRAESPPPPYEERNSLQRKFSGSAGDKFEFTHSDRYPPYLKCIPRKYQTGVMEIFNFTSLMETTAMLFIQPELLVKLRYLAPEADSICCMQDLIDRNYRLHEKSRQIAGAKGDRDMYYSKNIGHRDDWYTDSAFGQQQLTGTNPTTITLAPQQWIDKFKSVAQIQQRVDIARLLDDDAECLYIQDYSDFRSVMGVSASADFMTDGRYGCAAVVLFHLEPEGQLHPLAIVIDYKGSMDRSVCILNRRILSTSAGDEALDWPWRYAKMCAQVSDWLRHEVAVHLVNTHLVEEVVIVAAHRTIDPAHIIFKLLEPHWQTTLSLNEAARLTLVPKIIIGMVGFTHAQTYAFLKAAYSKFDWTNCYVPNDLRRRGFPIEDLDKFKYHNCGYARNIARMWDIIRNFVCLVLTGAYGDDEDVANDKDLAAFCREIRSQTGGQLFSFPDIETLDDLIDFVTMCIHVASPQHTAVNYLQQYYQTFIPNKPAALYTPLPKSLSQLQNFGEKEILAALPINRPRDWLVMAQVPYLLSFEVPDDSNILHYAVTTCQSTSSPAIIRDAARVLRDDLEDFISTVVQNSEGLDDQQTPYLVLDPSKTAISILI
ncbi:unnamed protein product [Cyclocybe aegerita]|uniref:Manganese lipoxygenase n=1 Tax=Cyclocybe aegerita TaxID=1973307 RepID=A0A8S0W943_CYCAE|nr:unnamed protein product [Cyclocybe aegerita]